MKQPNNSDYGLDGEMKNEKSKFENKIKIYLLQLTK